MTTISQAWTDYENDDQADLDTEPEGPPVVRRYVVDNGAGSFGLANGQTLVTVWPDGQVDADFRMNPRETWTPVSLFDGSVRVEVGQ